MEKRKVMRKVRKERKVDGEEGRDRRKGKN